MAHDFERTSLETHVELCGERYLTLERRIGRLERTVVWATAASLSGMGGIIVTLLIRLA